MGSINLIEVDSPVFDEVIRAAAKAGFDFAKELYQADINVNRTISREEAMKPEWLNCAKTKLQYLINSGDIQVTDTKPQHITVKSIIEYKKSKLRK